MNCRICGAALPDGAMFCGECGSSTTATPETRSRPAGGPSDTTVVEPLPSGYRPPERGREPGESVSTPPAAPGALPPAYVLRFSTGEVATVGGSGLVGRRPQPQPSESFDQLVHVDDRGLSVSKTHLEFGLHEGRLWIADRFSGNGSLIRRADGGVVRCEPGRRYLVERGSRIDMGEQSFTVE
ncbi:MAG: zinc-ribbon domain-containing protein [Leifsonia sp.]